MATTGIEGLRRIGRAAAGGVLALLAACADPAGTPAAGGDGTARAPAVFDVAGGRFLGEEALWRRLAAAEFVMLGETHDNPEHHRLQARIVRELAARPPGVGAVAFEMLTVDRQPLVDRMLTGPDADLRAFAEAVGWEESGWPDFAIYEPVFAAALESGARVLAADLASGTTRRIRRDGFAALDPELVRRTGLDRPLPPDLEAGLRDTLARAHCDRLPARMLPGLLRVQRARDAMMADRLAGFRGRGRVVLITGNGHARRDWGVPYYLRRMVPQRTVVSVGLVERVGGRERELAREPFDILWLTGAPGHRRGDPCDAVGGATGG